MNRRRTADLVGHRQQGLARRTVFGGNEYQALRSEIARFLDILGLEIAAIKYWTKNDECGEVMSYIMTPPTRLNPIKA